MIDAIFNEGLIFGIMCLGVFITFRILDFPDLTVDGSFPLGAAITAIIVSSGLSSILGFVLAFIGGVLAGVITATIHNKLKIPSLLAGILTMTMLYSINIRVMTGRPNIQLIKVDSLFRYFRDNPFIGDSIELSMLVFLLFIVTIIVIKVNFFFRTDLGLTIGALGNNPQMIISQGINPDVLKIIGVGFSNGLVALSGALFAEYSGASDVNLGQGIIVTGLASVMIGEFIGTFLRKLLKLLKINTFRENRISTLTAQVVLGAIVFKALVFFARTNGFKINMLSSDLKLLQGLVIVGLLAFMQAKKGARR